MCYDISEKKRLRNVFQTMRNYDDHVQYSVFEYPLTAIDLKRRPAELATKGHIVRWRGARSSDILHPLATPLKTRHRRFP